MMKNRRFGKALAMLMAAFVMVTTVFASDMTVEAASKKPAITLSAASGTIEVGKSTTISIKKATNKASKKVKDYTFKSSNNKVATVSSKGKITGVKSGSATITLTSKKKVSGKKVTAKYKVTVVKVLSKSISTAKSLTVVQGKTTNIRATVIPGDVTVKGVTYATSNKKIATVDKKGKVKGVKAGTAKITVTAKDGKAKTTVTVKVIAKNSKAAKKLASKVAFKTSAVTLTEGETYTQKATVTTKGSNKTVNYQSSNAKVATVDAKTGKVKAIAKGKATITAYATDGSNKSGKYTVTVNAKPAPQPAPQPTPTPDPKPEQPTVVPVDSVTISGAQTMAIKANAFQPIQLSAAVAPANATDKTVTWSVPANSCVTVDNTGLVSLNTSFNGVGTVNADVTAMAGEKSDKVTISVVYSEKVDILDMNGTAYGVALDKSAVGYTVSRGGKTRSVATEDVTTDLSSIAGRLNNWDGSVRTLNEKIDAHWGDSEGTILDLINAYSAIIGDVAIKDIKNEVSIVYNDDKYTVTRGERVITVSRKVNSYVANYPAYAEDKLVKYDFIIEESAKSRVISITNIGTEMSLVDGGKQYGAQADVTFNDTTKQVQMGALVKDGEISGAKVLADGGTTVFAFSNNGSTYGLLLNRSYYENLREKLGVSDYMSEIEITQTYR